LLRAKIEQFEAALKNGESQERRDGIAVAVQALKKYGDDGDDALKQYGAAKDPNQKRRFISMALPKFRQGLRYADQVELAFAATLQAPATPQSGQATSYTLCLQTRAEPLKLSNNSWMRLSRLPWRWGSEPRVRN
jgi:hypothetical protein